MGFYLFDQYSILHFAVGIIVYFWGFGFWSWTILHIIFECVENTPKGMYLIDKHITWWPGGKIHADTQINRFGDVMCGGLGWLLAKYIDKLGQKEKWYPYDIQKS